MTMLCVLLCVSLQAPEAAPVVEPERAALWAKAAAEMRPYDIVIPGTDVRFSMLPIPGGVYQMGSPEAEPGRRGDEGPRRWVVVDPFWLGKCEVSWDEYEQWSARLEVRRRPDGHQASEVEAGADAVSRPTPPYTDMTFGMGKDGFPAIGMTQHAAMKYTEWLSKKLSAFYRLPTEAEWEWAARAGTDTAFSFGADASQLDEFAWHKGNSDGHYHKVGLKKPNAWGLHDMHGNVSEWCLDQMQPYLASQTPLVNPWVMTTTEYPVVVRGGGWKERDSRLRCAARRGSSSEWKMQDPQIPQSIWYFTDAQWNGFRVARPFVEPSPAEQQKYLSSVVDHGR